MTLLPCGFLGEIILKKSYYNLVQQIENQRVLILNTLTGASVVMKSEDYANLENCEDEELFSACVNNGIIVEKDFDETSFVNFTRYANNLNNPNMHSFVILPTTSCNAKCVYCYEEGVTYTTMNLEVAKRTAEYIVSSSGGKDIKLMWFGGEPLLAVDVIDKITEIIVKSLKNEQKFIVSMISNSSLIDDTIISKMVNEWHLSRIQITLDGFEEEYNRRKRYIKPVDYKTILQNINILADCCIQVSIRLNFDRNNYEEILDLIDYLGDIITNKEFVSVYAIPLFAPRNCKNRDIYYDEDELDEQYFEIYNRLINNNFIRSQSYFAANLKSHFCGAMKLQHAVINTNGDIYKCQHINALGNEPVGDIFDGMKLCYNHTKWLNPIIDEKCEKCIYLPSCQGGCKVAMTENVFQCCLIKYTPHSSMMAINELYKKTRRITNGKE